VTNLKKHLQLLKILLALIAIFVFLFSVVSPYYHITIHGLEDSSQTYWSYKANYSAFTTTFISGQSWGFDYWFDTDNLSFIGGLWMSWIPLTMFVIQILTLAFGCATLAINRRIILSIPLCLSLTVLALMSYVGYRLSSALRVEGEYQLGYYLVYPSVALFAIAFILTEKRPKDWKS
jgi:hypothetical protein